MDINEIYKKEDAIADPRFLPWLYTLDSEQETLQNKSSWLKSNPSLDIVKKREYLDEVNGDSE